jgi:hypothetical protein
MVERVLVACEAERSQDMTSLVSLLRRFAVEAAREEARMFCDELVANDQAVPSMSRIDHVRMVA